MQEALMCQQTRNQTRMLAHDCCLHVTSSHGPAAPLLHGSEVRLQYSIAHAVVASKSLLNREMALLQLRSWRMMMMAGRLWPSLAARPCRSRIICMRPCTTLSSSMTARCSISRSFISPHLQLAVGVAMAGHLCETPEGVEQAPQVPLPHSRFEMKAMSGWSRALNLVLPSQF